MCGKGSVEREGRCIAVLKCRSGYNLLDLRPSEDQAGDTQDGFLSVPSTSPPATSRAAPTLPPAPNCAVSRVTNSPRRSAG